MNTTSSALFASSIICTRIVANSTTAFAEKMKIWLRGAPFFPAQHCTHVIESGSMALQGIGAVLAASEHVRKAYLGICQITQQTKTPVFRCHTHKGETK